MGTLLWEINVLQFFIASCLIEPLVPVILTKGIQPDRYIIVLSCKVLGKIHELLGISLSLLLRMHRQSMYVEVFGIWG